MIIIIEKQLVAATNNNSRLYTANSDYAALPII